MVRCMKRAPFWVAGVLAAVGMAGAQEPAAAAPELRVMTFNVRYGTADDGPNHWEKRREFVLETIRAFDPDLLGTQEPLVFQRDYFAEHLTNLAVLGIGREDGKDRGETTTLLYRRDRFELLGSGHFWISETPEAPGSKSWDSSLPRMATWVRLRDRQDPSARPIFFVNTHLDHRGAEARRQGALLLRRRLQAESTACRLVITGDFNAGEGSLPHLALFGEQDSAASPVRDAYRAARPTPAADEGTFSDFRHNATGGPRIDWIGVSPDWAVRAAEIVRSHRDGHTPSDHFPVTAILGR